MPQLAVEAILADDALDHEDSPSSRAEEMEKLYEKHGWETVRDYLMSVLEDPARSADDWGTVAIIFWSAVCDHRPVNVDRLIALLYKRIPADEGSSENNLVWSITSSLKGKSYLSSYDPFADPGVQRELETLD